MTDDSRLQHDAPHVLVLQPPVLRPPVAYPQVWPHTLPSLPRPFRVSMGRKEKARQKALYGDSHVRLLRLRRSDLPEHHGS